MNDIKRQNEFASSLLSYKFGLDNTFSEKVLLTSKINKRIILDKFTLYYSLNGRQSVNIAMENIDKYELDLTHHCAGNTSLHIAIIRDYPKEIIELLITEKNLNIKNFDGNTPLHIALNNKYSDEVIRLLITKENLTIRNTERYVFVSLFLKRKENQDKLPFELAELNGYSKEIVDLLKKK